MPDNPQAAEFETPARSQGHYDLISAAVGAAGDLVDSVRSQVADNVSRLQSVAASNTSRVSSGLRDSVIRGVSDSGSAVSKVAQSIADTIQHKISQAGSYVSVVASQACSLPGSIQVWVWVIDCGGSSPYVVSVCNPPQDMSLGASLPSGAKICSPAYPSQSAAQSLPPSQANADAACGIKNKAGCQWYAVCHADESVTAECLATSSSPSGVISSPPFDTQAEVQQFIHNPLTKITCGATGGGGGGGGGGCNWTANFVSGSSGAKGPCVTVYHIAGGTGYLVCLTCSVGANPPSGYSGYYSLPDCGPSAVPPASFLASLFPGSIPNIGFAGSLSACAMVPQVPSQISCSQGGGGGGGGNGGGGGGGGGKCCPSCGNQTCTCPPPVINLSCGQGVSTYNQTTYNQQQISSVVNNVTDIVNKIRNVVNNLTTDNSKHVISDVNNYLDSLNTTISNVTNNTNGQGSSKFRPGSLHLHSDNSWTLDADPEQVFGSADWTDETLARLSQSWQQERAEDTGLVTSGVQIQFLRDEFSTV